MTSGSATTIKHVFGSSDSTINSVAGRQAKQLLTGKARIMSLKVSNNQTKAMTVDFIDGAGASAFNGKLIQRVNVGAVRENLDFDMHGAIVNDGLYVVLMLDKNLLNLPSLSTTQPPLLMPSP